MTDESILNHPDMLALAESAEENGLPFVASQAAAAYRIGWSILWRMLSPEEKGRIIAKADDPEDNTLHPPLDADGEPINIGCTIWLPDVESTRRVVDGMVVLPTYRCAEYDRSCVVVRPDLWHVVREGV